MAVDLNSNMRRDMSTAFRVLKEEGPGSLWQRMHDRVIRTRQPALALSQPRVIELEISRTCNIRCVMCGRFKHKFPRAGRPAEMTPPRFEQILARLPAVRDISFRGGGDPFLNPHLFDLVKAAGDRGISVRTYTNGTLLDETRGQAVIDSGMAELTISFDGGRRETYERIRAGASFDEVTGHMGAFHRLKNRLGARRPVLSVLFIAMRDNVREIPEAVALFKSLGVEKVTIKNLDSSADESLDARVLTGEEFAWAVETGRQLNGDGIEVSVPGRSGLHDRNLPMQCWRAWMCPFISAEGDVSVCPGLYFFHDIRFGNLLRTPFLRLWNAGAARKLRRDIRKSRADLCLKCPEC
jgi:MoaA/NifB/PqqE/SkfB family radical SAM enzyme